MDNQAIYENFVPKYDINSYGDKIVPCPVCGCPMQTLKHDDRPCMDCAKQIEGKING